MSLKVDDRTLAHLQLVIVNKLRRNETFLFSWQAAEADGGGRKALWMHPGADLHFEFAEARLPAVNRAWAGLLVEAANSNTGLHLVPEPGEPAAPVVKKQAAHR